jgi:Uma2 family endonuclease
MASIVQPRYTPQEYVALERKAAYKSEYINGFIFAMAGASHRHNLIVVNVAREVSLQFKGRPCEIYVSDMRVNVSETGLYTYPDVVALCDEPRFEDAELDTLLNPSVIVEVLSESTEAYDRGEKFAHYRRLASLAEYVLIAQDKIRVEHYARQGEQWVLSEISDPGGTLHLASVGCDLALREIYDRVEFSENDVVAPNRNGAPR